MPRKKERHRAEGEVFSLDIPFNRTSPVDRGSSPGLSPDLTERISRGSDIPEFRENGQVCAYGFSFPAALESLF